MNSVRVFEISALFIMFQTDLRTCLFDLSPLQWYHSTNFTVFNNCYCPDMQVLNQVLVEEQY